MGERSWHSNQNLRLMHQGDAQEGDYRQITVSANKKWPRILAIFYFSVGPPRDDTIG
jgi:hypothetical protein